MQQVVSSPLHLIERKGIGAYEPEPCLDLGKQLANSRVRAHLEQLARTVKEVDLREERKAAPEYDRRLGNRAGLLSVVRP